VLFDTDVLVWLERGSERAARLLDRAEGRMISVQTYMELLQSAQSREQHQATRRFIADYGFLVLPLTENIGHRASIYVEEYTLSCGLRAGDAIIAATATENDLVLCSANRKHFSPIRDLRLEVFRP